MRPTDPHDTGTQLVVDLSALVANWRQVGVAAPGVSCAAVIKANAYGLGIEAVSVALSRAGAKTFFVAHLDEAARVRATLPDAEIFVLNGLPPGSATRFAALSATPILGDIAEMEEWAAFCATTGYRGAAALHADTGMTRLGLENDAALEVAVRHAEGTLGFPVSLVMSHMACADTPEHALNARQKDNFRAWAAHFPNVRKSLANSAAALSDPDTHYDLLRPGIALYGGNPFTGCASPMRPVVRLLARIIQVRHAKAGDSVGYGAAQTLARDARLAILSAGYADGLIRAAGGSDARPGAVAVVAGVPCPIIGRISMDLIALDVTDAPTAARGAYAELIGPAAPLDVYAEKAGTIAYEVLTGIAPRATVSYESI